MVLLHTPGIEDNSQAPDFTLKNINGNMLSYNDVKGENGTVIAFICNHCPYVHAIINRLVTTAKTLQNEGIGVVAIMPNDTENYPADNFDNMQKFADENGFTFPYLIDETQEIAKAYDAICTPDIFGINNEGAIKYRGRLDSAGAKEADENTIPELLNAMRDIAATGNTTAEQFSSMGCSIKWK